MNTRKKTVKTKEIAAGSDGQEGAGGKPARLMLAFYGDDFTGSTDALEFLNRAGARTVLFMEPPGPQQLARYPGLQAIGIAGMTRSMSPENMEKTLEPAFAALNQLDVPHIHYKVCSTFDSSPTTGSIGKAMEIGASVFSPEFIPLLAAAPALGRYCLFGNLFARMGTGGQGPVYRLDRHPSMSRHPVTPAGESDLRLHLSQQTRKKTGLLDILQVTGGLAEARQALNTLIGQGAEIVLFDALYEEQLPAIGELIDSCAMKGKKLFSVGSSGIEMALGAHWTAQGRFRPVQNWKDPGKAEPLLVISGSCSPVTRTQIARAVSRGFSEVVLDGGTTGGEDAVQPAVEKYVPLVISLMKKGRNVILHTGAGIAGHAGAEIAAHTVAPGAAIHFGTILGRVARAAAEQTPLRRLVIAGGDTSGHAARELGIEALEMIAPITPGAPLCKAFAPGSPADGLEVNFKGGQVGTEDHFEMVLRGAPQ